MARRVRYVRRGCVVLDSQALSLLIDGQELMVKRLDKARKSGVEVVTSVLTILEAERGGTDLARRDFVLSRIVVESVDQELATLAGELLRANRLHGHRHAIDAVLAATALRQEAPVIIYTSDPEDLAKLCDAPQERRHVSVMKV